MKRVNRIISLFLCAFLMAGVRMPIFAAGSGTADAIVAFAESCAGKSCSQLGLSGEWCARFVYYCAQNSGCSSIIGSSVYVGTLAEQTVNDKGGTITFVNQAAYNACKSRFNSTRVKYDPSYKPKKGDLYIQKGEDLGDQYFAHIGIVRSNSNYNYLAYTVEGNTSCDDGKHTDYNNVEYKTRNNNNLPAPYGFSAFITPNYKSSSSHTITYDLEGGSGSFPAINVQDGGSFNVNPAGPRKLGYSFSGWYVQRSSDQKWYVAGYGWKEWNTIYSSGLEPKTYSPGDTQVLGSSWTQDGGETANFKFVAQWTPKRYKISYETSGGAGRFDTVTLDYYGVFTIPTTIPTKNGYEFKGWKLARTYDGKIYVNGQGWKTLEEIDSNNLSVRVYDPGTTLTLGISWVEDGVDYSNYAFIALWEPISHTHTWSSTYTIDKQPTCTSRGSKSIHCTICNEMKPGSSVTMPKTDHTYGAWKVVREATYTSTGLEERTCSKCGAKQQQDIPKLPDPSKPNLSVKSLWASQHSVGKVLFKWTKKDGVTVTGWNLKYRTRKIGGNNAWSSWTYLSNLSVSTGGAGENAGKWINVKTDYVIEVHAQAVGDKTWSTGIITCPAGGKYQAMKSVRVVDLRTNEHVGAAIYMRVGESVQVRPDYIYPVADYNKRPRLYPNHMLYDVEKKEKISIYKPDGTKYTGGMIDGIATIYGERDGSTQLIFRAPNGRTQEVTVVVEGS